MVLGIAVGDAGLAQFGLLCFCPYLEVGPRGFRGKLLCLGIAAIVHRSGFQKCYFPLISSPLGSSITVGLWVSPMCSVHRRDLDV